MNKREAIQKKLEGRIVDKIDLRDMQKDYEDSYYHRFMKELESWQQEAEKIITDSGVILQGEIKAGSLHNGDAVKIKLPLKLPVSYYDRHYIQNVINMLITIKTIQKQLASCASREERQRCIDLINLGRSFRMAEVTFHYPQITTDVISEKNQTIAKSRRGAEGPLKKMVRMIGKKQDKPSIKSIIKIMGQLAKVTEKEQMKYELPLIIQEVDHEKKEVAYKNLKSKKEALCAFKTIENYISNIFPSTTS